MNNTELARRVSLLEQNYKELAKEVSAMNTTDAVQNQKLEQLQQSMDSNLELLRAMHNNLQQMTGGRKFAFGLLALVSSVVGIFVALQKFG